MSDTLRITKAQMRIRLVSPAEARKEAYVED